MRFNPLEEPVFSPDLVSGRRVDKAPKAALPQSNP
jgi:hypothetical protein